MGERVEKNKVCMKKIKRGGKREGSGKPEKYGEPTVHLTFRVPVSKKEEIKALVKNKLLEYLPKKSK